MIENRSVPPNTLLPHVRYRDIEAAIAWLTEACGFREQYRYGDPIGGAQMRLGSAWIMLRNANDSGKRYLTVFIDEMDSHFEKAKTAGARITEEPHETEYGEYQYGAEDLDGHHWLFSRHAHDVSPADWGALALRSCTRIPDCLRAGRKAVMGCSNHARAPQPSRHGCNPQRQGITPPEAAGRRTGWSKGRDSLRRRLRATVSVYSVRCARRFRGER